MIKIATSLRSALENGVEQLYVQLSDASQREHELHAMQAARDALLQADETIAPSFVSAVISHPHGPIVFADVSSIEPEYIHELVTRMAQAIESAGVSSGLLRVPARSNELDHIQAGETAVLVAFAPPSPNRRVRQTIPSDWTDAGAEWLAAAEGVDHFIGTWFASEIEVPLSVDMLAAFARPREVDGMMQGARLYAIGDQAARAVVCGLPNVGTIAFADRTRDVPSAIEELKRLARLIRPAFVYACIPPTLDNLPGHARTPSAARRNVRGDFGALHGLTDIFVPDIFDWQVLSPSHIERLPETPNGIRWPDGRVEVEGDEARRTLGPIVLESTQQAVQMRLDRGYMTP